MSVVLSEAGAKKLKEIVRKVDAMKPNRGGLPLAAGPAEDQCWGYLTGCDLSGRRYSFVRVLPDASADDPDVILDGGLLKYRILDGDPPHIYTAYEANGAVGISTGRIVRLTFAGFRPADDGEQDAVYVFAYEKPEPDGTGLPIHDHRDNVTGGGFAFSCYHPGTSLPQQPWHP